MGIDKELMRETFTVERKFIEVLVRENERGQFVRISEYLAGKSNSMIIPVAGLDTLIAMLGAAKRAAGTTPG